MQKNLTAYDMKNISNPESREDVEDRLSILFGDFQEITDFRADFHIGDQHIIHDWASEEGEQSYHDAMSDED
jgi:hypothetical protein